VRKAVVLALIAACGRIRFDPAHASADDGAPGDSAPDACGSSGTWLPGDVVTYSQSAWRMDSTASATLANGFAAVYPSDMIVGSTFTVELTSAAAIAAYLPAAGPAAPLTADLVDPTSTPSGTLGGDTLALKLDVDFADADLLAGNLSIRFGDLTLCSFTAVPSVNELTVRQFLAQANQVLGGNASVLAYADVDALAAQLAGAFSGGMPCAFAAQHMIAGVCP
jgi:hypothetical protein